MDRRIKTSVLLFLMLQLLCTPCRSAASQLNHDTFDLNTPRQQVIIVSGAGAGLGDYTYGLKIRDFLQAHYPENDYVLMLYGSNKDRIKVEKVYGLHESKKNDFIWISADCDGYFFKYVCTREELVSDFASRNIIKSDAVFIYASAVGMYKGRFGFMGEHLLNPLVVLNYIYTNKIAKKEAQAVLHDVILGLNYTEKTPSIFEKQYRLTHESRNDNSHSNINEDRNRLKDINDEMNGIYNFGFNGKRKKLGFMLSSRQKELAAKYKTASVTDRKELLKEAGFSSYFLNHLTPEAYADDPLIWLAETGDFITAYMNRDFSLIEFIAATAPVVNREKDLKYVMNMSNLLYKNRFFQPSEQQINMSELIKKVLTDNHVSKVIYWSSGMTDPETTMINDDGGRTAWILNPFPLKNQALELLFIASKYPFSGCTGDHSLYDILSIGKIPLRETVPHTFGLQKQFSKRSEELGLVHLSALYGTFRADEKSKHLSGAIKNGEWSLFLKDLWQHQNAYDRLTSIFNKRLERLAEEGHHE